MYQGVKSVSPMADYKLALTFENGERRIFDVTPWLAKAAFRELHNEALFRTVKVSFDTIEWANGADLCPETLYEDNVPLETARKPALAVAEQRARYSVGSARKLHG